MIKLYLLACAAALPLLAGCGGGGSAAPAAPPVVQPPAPTVTLSISANMPDARVGGYPIVFSAASQPSGGNEGYQWSLEAGAPGSLSVGTDGKATYTPPASGTLASATMVNIKVTSAGASKTFAFGLYPGFGEGSLKTLVAAGSGQFIDLADALGAPDGSYLLVDDRKNAVYRLNESGVVTVAAGLREEYTNKLFSPTSIAWSPEGVLHIFESGGAVKKITTGTDLAVVKTIPPLYNEEQLNGSGPLVIDQSGNIYLTDWHTIRKVAPDGTLTTLAGKCDAIGSHSGDIVCGDGKHLDGTGTDARFVRPLGMALAADGSLLVADKTSLRKVTMQGVVTTLADAPAEDVRVDAAAGTLFVGNNAVRRLNADGSIATLAAALGPADDFLRRAIPLDGKRLLLVYKDSVQVLQLP
jgi:sugar lactone lactonase YvrE